MGEYVYRTEPLFVRPEEGKSGDNGVPGIAYVGHITPEIDLMVDVALSVPGVAGAQLAGAGLGGCMMVLAHRDATAELAERMNGAYYERKGLAPDVSVCTPIAGSGVLLSPRRAAMS